MQADPTISRHLPLQKQNESVFHCYDFFSVHFAEENFRFSGLLNPHFCRLWPSAEQIFTEMNRWPCPLNVELVDSAEIGFTKNKIRL